MDEKKIEKANCPTFKRTDDGWKSTDAPLTWSRAIHTLPFCWDACVRVCWDDLCSWRVLRSSIHSCSSLWAFGLLLWPCILFHHFPSASFQRKELVGIMQSFHQPVWLETGILNLTWGAGEREREGSLLADNVRAMPLQSLCAPCHNRHQRLDLHIALSVSLAAHCKHFHGSRLERLHRCVLHCQHLRFYFGCALSILICFDMFCLILSWISPP